ncbi:hypothetical protein Tco_0965310 [Tanacetum coccineum]
MDYQCTQAEEMERNRVDKETMQMLQEMIKIQEEKRIFEEPRELLSNDSPPLPKNESFSLDHFNDPSLPRPPPEPPDVEICFNFESDAGVVTKKVVGDISEHDVPMPNLLPTQPNPYVHV